MKFWSVSFLLLSFGLHADGYNETCNFKRKNNHDFSVGRYEDTNNILPHVRKYAEQYPTINSGDLGNPVLDKMLMTQRLVVNAARGDLSQVQFLIGKKVFVDSRRDEPYYTALTLAAICGRVDVVNMLIESGADVNAYVPYFNGYSGDVTLATILSTIQNLDADVVRSEANRKAVIEILVKNGARANEKEINIHENINELQRLTYWYRLAGFKDVYSIEELKIVKKQQ